MKKPLLFLSLFISTLFFFSCKNDASLQNYLVETSSKEGFYTGDLPVSSVISSKMEVSKDVEETIKSIKKINVAFLPKTSENEMAYQEEKEKLKYIFNNNSDYKSLMSMKMQGMNIQVYYSGETDAIDEVVAFGYGNENGVGIARLLGENMNPAQVISMMNSIKVDENSETLKSFMEIFNN